MKVEVVMPKMGESLQEGTITKWLKKEGEEVERDEMILEISTDKVDTEVPSPKSGVLKKILAEEGETVEVGEVIAELETEGNGEEPKKAEPEAKEKEEDKKDDSNDSADSSEDKKEEGEDTEGRGQDGESDEDDAELETQDSGDGLTEVVMPKMGESLQEGTITKWLKKEGDDVERDEMILEISTDKVDTEVPSPVAGKITDILAEEGDTIEVGEVIAKISTGGSGSPKKAKKEEKESKGGGKDKKEDKSKSKSAESKKENKIEAPAEGTKEIPREHGGKFFSPLVRSIAEKEGVTLEELAQIDGSGQDGRVNKGDLLDYIEQRPEKGQQTKRAEEDKSKKARKDEKDTAAKPEEIKGKAPQLHYDEDEVEIIPMDRIRQIIAEHMVYSKKTSPHVMSVAEADVTGIVNFRNKVKEKFQKEHGFKLTFTPFFALASIEGIREFPMVNVSVDGKKIIRHKRIHMSFATALPDGNLIVPVIKKADDLNLTGLARSVDDLATRARNKKLDPDDIQGGTFTITNVGTFGSLFGAPIINQPQTAILGIGAIQKRPVVKEVGGEDIIVPRSMVYLSINYDHRVIDGMLAGKCLRAIVQSLENMNEDTLSI